MCLCSVVPCPPGPACSWAPSLCPRCSHLISASSTWSLRCGSSGRQQCRQRYEPQAPPPPPPQGHISPALSSLLDDPSSSSRSSTGSCTTQWPRCSLQHSKMPVPSPSTSKRYQEPLPSSSTLRPGPRAQVWDHHHHTSSPGLLWGPRTDSLDVYL